MDPSNEIHWHIGETGAPLPVQVPGLPLLGNALQLRSDPTRAIVKMYQSYGPIFRLRILNRRVTVLAGLEANRFAIQNDEAVFTNAEQFHFLVDELGPVMTALPPEQHRYMRRLMRPVYAPSAVSGRLNELVQVVDEFVDTLRPGDRFEVFPTLQRLVVNQLGAVMLNQPPGEYFDDFRVFMLTMLQVYQFHTRSPKALRSSQYRQAKQRALEMGRQIVEHTRRTRPGVDRPANGIDLLLSSVDENQQPFGEASLLSEALAPYLAGQDTVAGTLTFLCYTIHKHTDVLERIFPEVRQAFAGGVPGLDGFRKLDSLHKTIVETMRLYPVATFMPRHACQAFEFAGYRVESGTEVYSATSVTHFLPEFYPDPFTFNIDRERGQSGTYAPYGVGNYACLGAGIADIQLMVTLAALLRRGRFELDPPDYTARMQPMPLPNPGRFHLRMVEKYTD